MLHRCRLGFGDNASEPVPVASPAEPADHSWPGGAVKASLARRESRPALAHGQTGAYHRRICWRRALRRRPPVPGEPTPNRCGDGARRCAPIAAGGVTHRFCRRRRSGAVVQ